MNLRNYKYEAKNNDGKPIKGRIEAINRATAIKFLQMKSLKVIQLKEYRNFMTTINQISFGSLLNTKQLVFFLKQLGSLLNAGVNILQSLELLSLQQESRFLRKVYFELYQEVYNGFSLSKALAKRPKEFPSLMVQMVEIGELSGNLAKMILDMADYYEKQMKTTSEIKGAIRMPLIYLGAAIAIAFGMILFVFPNMTALFSAFGDAKLPGITQFFLDAGDFLINYSLIVFGLLGLLVIAIILLNKYVAKFHRALVLIALNTPIFGNLIQMNNQVSIANSLSQMMASGINTIKALATVKSFTKNVIYKELLGKTISYIDDGLPFSKAFSESDYIDPIMARMIATGEKTGEIPKLMNNLAIYYNGVSSLRVQQLKNSIQPILLLVVYAIVGVMILALMLPMLSLGTQI